MIEIKVPIIPGKSSHIIGKIEVKVGGKVKEKDILLQIETAKGNREIRADKDGIIADILVKEGDEVKSSQVIILIDEEELNFDDNKKSDELSKKSETNNNYNKKDIIKKDLLIIGAGPGGYGGAIYAAKRGLDVLLVEKANLGGTCLNEGCIPTKSLIESGLFLSYLDEMDIFGIDLNYEANIDIKKVLKRKDNVVNELKEGIKYLIEKNNIELLYANAKFIEDNKVLADDTIIEADNIIIATGSISNKLNIEGYDLDGVIDSKDALNLHEIPQTLTIIGGGVIGLEFAFIYNSFGTKINIIEYEDSLIPMFDREASSEILKVLESKGIRVSTGSKVISIKETLDDELIITYEKDGKENVIVSNKVLMATGRKANIKGLDLDKTSIIYNKENDSIKVNEFKQTNIDNIYAIGDVSNRLKLAHLATHEAMIAVDHILGEDNSLDDLNVPSVIYTDPEIAVIGYSEEDLIKNDISYKVSKINFASNGKALTMNKNNGFIKIMGNNEDKILGAVIVGVDAQNLIANISIAMKNNISIKDLTKTVFAHPTSSEVIFEACLEFLDRGIHS